VFAEPGELRADLVLAMAESTQVRARSSRRATRRWHRPTIRCGAPSARVVGIDGHPAFVPEIDRSDGRLDATVSIGGTLGEPRFDGEFHVRDGVSTCTGPT